MIFDYDAGSSLKTKHGPKLKRLRGAGRKLMCPEMDEKIMDWLVVQRGLGLRVSRRMIQEKGRTIFVELNASEHEFKGSTGWLNKFLDRHGLSLRRRTTIAQEDPEMLLEKIVNFVMFVSRKIDELNVSPSNIIAMDETSLWFDMISSTIDTIGSKSVPLKSTRNE